MTTKPAQRRRSGNRPGRQGGFTILEMLVAIAILLIATTGPMVFAQQSLRAARLSRDQVTAFYLAQDAVEFVKHVRDENSLTALRADWLLGLEECFGVETNPNSGCQVSVPEWSEGDTAAAVLACPTESCALYERDGLFGIFGSGADARSRFSRRVKIMTPTGCDPTTECPGDVSGSEEVLVEVEVSWASAGISGNRNVLVREHIYNWIQ